MGFFSRSSSQSAPEHPPSEAYPKSRWFSSSKSKDRAPPAPITHPTSSPTLPARDDSTLPPPLASVLPASNVSSLNRPLYGSTSTLESHANEFAFSSSSGQRPGLERGDLRKGKAREEDPETLDLAGRLAVLAASHKDGLLGDDEYRDLRQLVFENHQMKSSAARASENDAPNSQASLRTPTQLSRAISTSSSSSHNPPSLFRLHNSRTPLSGKPPDPSFITRSSSMADSASLRSTTSSTGRTTHTSILAIPLPSSSSRDSMSLSSPSRRSSFVSNHSMMSTSTRDRGSSAPPSAFSPRSGGSRRVGSQEEESATGSRATSAQIRQEISLVEKERETMIEYFKKLKDDVMKGWKDEDGQEFSDGAGRTESEWTIVADPSRPSFSPSTCPSHKVTPSTSTIRSSASLAPLASSTSTSIFPARKTSQSRTSFFSSIPPSTTASLSRPANVTTLSWNPSFAPRNIASTGSHRSQSLSISSSSLSSRPTSSLGCTPSTLYSDDASVRDMDEQQRKLQDIQRKTKDTWERYEQKLLALKAAEIKAKARI